MNLSNNHILELTKIATQAALKAGELINSYNGKNIEVLDKTESLSADEKIGRSLASSVVTEVDIKAQEIILSYLEPIAEKYDIAILTEESTDNKQRHTKDYFWAIDPIDGTLPFTEQKHGYSISIALVSKNANPVIGVVYDPMLKKLYTANEPQGVLLNGETWEIEKQNRPKIFELFVDRSFLTDSRLQATKEICSKIFQEQGFDGVSIKNVGGSVISALSSMDNFHSAYFKFPKPQTGGGSIWDYSATAAIAKYGKSSASDIFGEPLDLNTEVSTFMNHKGILYCNSEEVKNLIIKMAKKFID